MDPPQIFGMERGFCEGGFGWEQDKAQEFAAWPRADLFLYLYLYLYVLTLLICY